MTLTIGSLFSGVGGLELGLEWSGLGPTIWQVEKDWLCHRVLAANYPDVERFDDVCTVGAHNLAQVDLICGGFPCTDLSSAGAGEGLAGKRSGLWRQFARIVSEMRPGWVAVENVASGADAWVDPVRADLAERCYETLPVPVSADAVGAPYPRERIFVVARRRGRRLADADGDGESTITRLAEVAGASAAQRLADGARYASEWERPVPDVSGVVPGPAGQVAYQRMAGNCVVPACAEVVGYVIQELTG